jgi:hypothetical protein
MSAEGRRTGFMVGVIRMKNLMDAIADPDIARGYVVTLYEGPLLIFGPNRDDDWDHSQWAADAEFQTDELSLRIQVWPSGELERSLRSRGPIAILALGLTLALLMGVILYRMRGWKTRALAAEAALAGGVGAASVASDADVTGVPPITSAEPPAC